MTAKDGRRLSATSGHRRTSSKSSSNATSIEYTPPASSPSVSPTSDMPANIEVLRTEVEHTNLNGSIRSSKRNPRAFLDRKPSAPMMPAFMVSAPGKVIVFGEHAVVHGKVRQGR